MRSKEQLSKLREATVPLTLITLHADRAQIYTQTPVKRWLECAELITSGQTQPSAHLAPALALPQADTACLHLTASNINSILALDYSL